MINLTLDEAKKIAAEGDYKVIPISCEIFSDVKDTDRGAFGF